MNTTQKPANGRFSIEMQTYGSGGEHIDDIADAVLFYHELMDELGIPTANIVGHSMGGMLAAEIAAFDVHRANKLVPIAPVGGRGLTVMTNLNSEGSPQLRFLIGDFTTLQRGKCVCGRTFARARGGFNGRDDMLNIRGLKVFPSVVEEIVRSFEALGNEFQIVLETEGVMDSFTIVAETVEPIGEAGANELVARLEAEAIRQCELHPRIRLASPGTLPRTEFKARRVID